MRKSFVAIVIMALFGCGKNDPGGFPIGYSFTGYDQSGVYQFLVGPNGTFTELSKNIGTLGQNFEEEKMSSLNILLDEFDLREITLINDDSLEIYYLQHNIPNTNTLLYVLNNGEINIIPHPNDHLIYNKSKDRFEVQGVTIYSSEGIGCSKPGLPYNQYKLGLYIEDFEPEDYIVTFLSEHPFCASDTIVLNINHIFYGK